MIKSFLFVFLLLFHQFVIAQQACPVNFNTDSLNIASAHVNEWHEKMIALNVSVLSVEREKNDKAYLHCTVQGGGDIWVCSVIEPDSIKTGQINRVLGFFSKLEEADSHLLKYNSDGFHVVAIAEINLATKQIKAIPGSEGQLREWISGKVPEGGQ